jgi:hypothetical protein
MYKETLDTLINHQETRHIPRYIGIEPNIAHSSENESLKVRFKLL